MYDMISENIYQYSCEFFGFFYIEIGNTIDFLKG